MRGHPLNDITPLIVVGVYLLVLLGIGIASNLFFRGTSNDYFVASRSIGPFMLLMSVFGTTMTAFALVGSTGKAYDYGIGVYGLMASSSGLVHSACFFLVGMRLWAIGKRYGYLTQCQFFRARFDSNALGFILFPILVALIVPYLLIGLLGAGAVMKGVTIRMFPDTFAATGGAIPPWLTGLVLSLVVLTYVFVGGVRSTAWANTFQTLVFMVTGLIAFFMISRALGGLQAASEKVAENAPQHLAREGLIGRWQFLTYFFVPLSVGMFPHLFQHWLTARSARTFRATIIAHPLCIMIVWVPCILIGIWVFGAGLEPPPGANANAILGVAVKKLVHAPVLSGLLTAGILAAIMSSLDSQFMCLGTMFTNDIVVPLRGSRPLTDRQKLWTGRIFVLAIVAVTYIVSLNSTRHIFDLAVWCFSGFAALFPIVLAAIYWRRTSATAVIWAILITTVAWWVLFIRSGFGGEYLLFQSWFRGDDGIMPVALLTLLCAAVIIAVSLVSPPPPKVTVDKFFPR